LLDESCREEEEGIYIREAQPVSGAQNEHDVRGGSAPASATSVRGGNERRVETEGKEGEDLTPLLETLVRTILKSEKFEKLQRRQSDQSHSVNDDDDSNNASSIEWSDLEVSRSACFKAMKKFALDQVEIRRLRRELSKKSNVDDPVAAVSSHKCDGSTKPVRAAPEDATSSVPSGQSRINEEDVSRSEERASSKPAPAKNPHSLLGGGGKAESLQTSAWKKAWPTIQELQQDMYLSTLMWRVQDAEQEQAKKEDEARLGALRKKRMEKERMLREKFGVRPAMFNSPDALSIGSTSVSSTDDDADADDEDDLNDDDDDDEMTVASQARTVQSSDYFTPGESDVETDVAKKAPAVEDEDMRKKLSKAQAMLKVSEARTEYLVQQLDAMFQKLEKAEGFASQLGNAFEVQQEQGAAAASVATAETMFLSDSFSTASEYSINRKQRTRIFGR